MAFASDKVRQGAAGVSTGYDIDNSLRFNDNDSAYLSWTAGTATNRKIWTYSAWVKGVSDATNTCLLYAGDSTNFTIIDFTDTQDGHFRLATRTSGDWDSYKAAGPTWRSQTFRDPSAWYHIVVAFDSTEGTPSDRMRLYINGSLSPTYEEIAEYTSDFETHANNNVAHYIGYNPFDAPNYTDGYLAEVNFVDGQALTPSDFGETDEDYGHWKAKKYTGTYGTNGFYLDFKTSGSLGNDANGSNNWTVNNLAATDQMLDSPTNNFATMNPLNKVAATMTYSEGNTHTVPNTVWGASYGTISVGSGKWYYEFIQSANVEGLCGFQLLGAVDWDATNPQYFDGFVGYELDNGYIRLDGSNVATKTSALAGDIIGVAIDMDSGTIQTYKNGASTGSATSFTSSTYYGEEMTPAVGAYYSTSKMYTNFGQDSSFAGNKTAQGNQDSNSIGDFYYAPPTGYLALCTQNLPEPAVIPSEHFNTVTWTGNNASTRSITGVGFQPDLVWHKARNQTWAHLIYDSIRGTGANAELSSQSTGAEGWTNADEYGYLYSFDSDGFTATQGSAGWAYFNASAGSFVNWNWKAGGADVLNENGTIDSQVSANADAGFSIVSYTGNGTSGATIGHGLSSAPEMVIVKSRSNVEYWFVQHSTLGATKYMVLQETGASGTSTTIWNDTAPTNSVFSVGGSTGVNQSAYTYIAYCFHSVEGYSKVGSYTGNGSTDGTFVYTGFRPAYVMIKNAANSSSWVMYDNKRDTYNAVGQVLYANSSGAESDTRPRADLLSNGFKLRSATEPNWSSSNPIIYIAFAETPFKYTNAR